MKFRAPRRQWPGRRRRRARVIQGGPKWVRKGADSDSAYLNAENAEDAEDAESAESAESAVSAVTGAASGALGEGESRPNLTEVQDKFVIH